MCSPVFPLAFTASISAPFATSSLQIGVKPFCAAMCIGRLLFLGSSQLARSASVTSDASSPSGLFQRIALWIFLVSSSDNAREFTAGAFAPRSCDSDAARRRTSASFSRADADSAASSSFSRASRSSRALWRRSDSRSSSCLLAPRGESREPESRASALRASRGSAVVGSLASLYLLRVSRPRGGEPSPLSARDIPRSIASATMCSISGASAVARSAASRRAAAPAGTPSGTGPPSGEPGELSCGA